MKVFKIKGIDTYITASDIHLAMLVGMSHNINLSNKDLLEETAIEVDPSTEYKLMGKRELLEVAL